MTLTPVSDGCRIANQFDGPEDGRVLVLLHSLGSSMDMWRPQVARLADVVIAPRVGPEVLAGSTRMKAGTATKLVLNRMTLLAMIRLKKVYGPYMVELRPGSAKLRDR